MKRFLEKHKIRLIAALCISILTNLLVPAFGNSPIVKAAGGTDLGDIFTGVKLTRNGSDLPLTEPLADITADTEIGLVLTWAIPDGTPVYAGDYARVTVPSVFQGIHNAGGDLEFDGGSVGTYSYDVSTGVIEIIFNDQLQPGGGHDEGRNGTIGINLRFNLEEFEDDTSQTVHFEDIADLDFTITIKPASGGSAITKSEEHEEQNPREVLWTINVNTDLKSITDARVEDVIPDGLALAEDSVKVYELAVGYNGKLTQGVVTGGAITVGTPAGGFTVGLGDIKSAYQITYTTNITDYSKAPYENDAVLFGNETQLGTDTAIINQFHMAAMIEKFGEANYSDGLNANTITWTVDVNKAEFDMADAVVSDTISANQSIKNETIKVYKLVKNGSAWNVGDEMTDAVKAVSGSAIDAEGNLQFPIRLGNLDGEAYRIVYDADILYGEDYYWEADNASIYCANEATLTDEGADPATSVSSSAAVTVTRGALLDKSSVAQVNYDVKEITWTIVANAGNHPISNAVIHDQLPVGLELKPGSVVVKDKDDQTVPAGGYTVSEVAGDGKFTISLGNISSKYTITYVTTVQPAFYGSTFTNKAWLAGDGTGIGPGTSWELAKTAGITPGIVNSYEKSTIGGSSAKTVDGITYNGIDYANKTMSWHITVKPVKEPVTALTITDTFPKDGMIFLENSLRVTRGTTLLVKNTDYTVGPASRDGVPGYQYGFILELKGDSWQGADYHVYYKTSFDLDKPGIISVTGTQYENKAEFIATTASGIKTATPPTVSYGLSPEASNNGKKTGALDRQNKQINWKIYTNYLALTATGSSITIKDDFSAGQSLDMDSFVVTQYTLNSGGTTSKTGLPLKPETDYTVTLDADGLGFTLVISKDPDQPYLIEYNTKLEGLSQGSYTNTAVVTSKSTNTYTTGVTYPSHGVFLEKWATDVDSSKKVYPDDEINWKVAVNKSMSVIQNAVFTDIISSGHVYVNGSLKVYRVTSVNNDGNTLAREELAPEDYTLTSAPDSGGWKLTVAFNNTIASKYEIEYKTVVTAASGSIQNSATLKGEGVDSSTGTGGGTTFTVTQTSFGTGGGTTNKGSLIINKKDAETGSTITLPAVFELYYYLNGEKKVVSGESQSTAGGVLTYTGLSYRTYYLREAAAPEGYLLDDTVYEIEVKSATVDPVTKSITKDILNTAKKAVKVIKTDEKDDTIKLLGAKFKLVKVTGTDTEMPVAEGITDINGELLFTGLEPGQYRLIETEAPTGYQLPANTVTEVGMIDTAAVNPIIKEIRNIRLKTIKIIKIDTEDTTKTLEGAQFKLYDSNNQQIGGIYTTDVNGEIVISGLKAGSYRLVEVAAPAGYHLPDDPVTSIEITYDMDEAAILPSIGNQVLRSIKVVKADSLDSQTVLAGAEFELWKGSVKVAGGIATDENGIAVFPDLLLGEYTLIETKAPDGYLLPENPSAAITIETGAPLQLQKIIKNDMERTLVIKKTDSTNPSKPLSGAEFTITCPDGTKRTVTTGEDGTATLTGLAFGTYTVTEVKAPDGYLLNRTPKTIVIDGSEVSFTIEAVNIKSSPYEPGGTTPTPAPGTDPTPTPAPGTEPTPTPAPGTDPTPTPVPTPGTGLTPTPTPIVEITPEDTPKGGTVPVGEGDKPSIGKDPEHGTVTVDEGGNWVYTPDQGYTGEDSFTVVVKKPDGTEEEILVEIDVEPVPLGTNPGDMPKTGGNHLKEVTLFALLGCTAGLLAATKKRRVRENQE